MIALIEDNRAAIESLCRTFHVARLELFGSAADGTFQEQTSDLDFLVEFRRVPEISAVDQYFGLLEAFQDLLHKKIDLVETGAMRNPYFIKAVNESRRPLFAA